MSKLSFSTLQLIYESKNDSMRFNEPNYNLFNQIPTDFETTENGVFYKLHSELDQNYFFLVAEFGKTDPHREKVVDVNTYKEEKNKRKVTQVELTNQSFLYYSFSTNLLYLSNTKHIKLFNNILVEKTGCNLFIKRIFINFAEFSSIIKSVHKIKFTGFNNLFSVDSKQFQAIRDLTGTSSPESFTIETNYSQGKISDFLHFLHLSKEENKIDKLIICGLDESDLETVYNVDTFTNQISIDCNKNDEGVYSYNEIKNQLISKTANL
jgi:hypothetical protein